METHKKTFDNFFLLNAFKVENKVQIETAMKNDPLLKTLRRTIRIQGTPQTELLCIDNHTYEQIDKQIEDIIQSVEYNPENSFTRKRKNKTRIYHSLRQIQQISQTYRRRTITLHPEFYTHTTRKKISKR